MKRNMKKAIDYYMNLATKNSSARYQIYCDEIIEIYKLSSTTEEGIYHGLMAGFAIGYKAGRKDQKDGRQ